ncbi:MAG: cold shock domain-containing protein [Calditrichaeota bacterium]|nr:cold shock domain-containing protein [Calditrichota bacterium]
MNQSNETKSARRRGVVLSFLKRKGYGFIRSDEHPKIFVHYTSILDEGFKTLLIGEEVEFTLKTTKLGLQAVDVARINPPIDDAPEFISVERKSW